MPAELVVVAGSQAGKRYSLQNGECVLGRAPGVSVFIDDPECSWRHCVITTEAEKYVLKDMRSAMGTFVNGLRVSRHTLADNDHVQIGESVLVFQKEAARTETGSCLRVLMNACVLIFLFRALAESQRQEYAAQLERHLVQLIADLVPAKGGWILLGRGDVELLAAAQAAGRDATLLKQASRLGVCVTASGEILVPLYVGSVMNGLVVMSFPEAEKVRMAEHQETLSAVATLAATALETVREVEGLRVQKNLLEERLGAENAVVGESAPMHRLSQMIGRVAPRETTVLVLGESGTGKELVARSLHALSPRRNGPFVALNCAALTETLLESELFGHEKGAFTGAVAQKKGKLELAEGGTVFLDEIGELAPLLQAKLLRVLQQREFERVGGTETRRLDVRIIAATNRDLAQEVSERRFREDLYHRLNVVTLRTPPLRERKEDVLPLARRFLMRAAARSGRRLTGISAEAEHCLLSYHWPGNVRELENAIERAVVLGNASELLPEDLPETVIEPVATEGLGAYQSSVGEAKRDCILRAYEQADGDYRVAAQLLNIHPNYLLRLVRNLGLKDLLRTRKKANRAPR